VIRYFLRSLGAAARHGRTLYILSVVGVALGVASVLSIQIINQGALATFRGGLRAVSGEADFTVMGRFPSFPESLYAALLSVPGVEAAWPLYQVDVALASPGQPGPGRVEAVPDQHLEIYGVDLFAGWRAPFLDDVASPEDGEPRTNREPGPDRKAGPEGGSGTDRERGSGRAAREAPRSTTEQLSARLMAPLADSGWIAVTPALAREMGWEVGERFAVSSGSRRVELKVGALVDFQRYAPQASRRIAIMDLAQSQSLLGRPGELHQIDVRLAAGAERSAVMEETERRLGPSIIQAVTAEQREAQVGDLLSAFRLNLTALSLISVFAGVVVIFSSTQASLVRRRAEFGLLRSLGATPRQLLALILAEVVLQAIAGTALGVALGYLAAVLNVERVSGTLTNIYLLQELEGLRIAPLSWLLAVLVGVGGALLGAILPAIDLSRRDPRSLLGTATLREESVALAPLLAAIGLALLGAAWIWFVTAGREVQARGFILGFFLLAALPLMTPLAIRLVCGRIRPRGFNLVYSLNTIGLRLHTTAFAVAALEVAVTMMVGITLLVGSFRQTLDTWAGRTLRADVFVTTPAWARAGSRATVDPAVVERLRGQPSVAALETLRQFPARSGARPVNVGSLGSTGEGWEQRLVLRSGDPAEVARRMRTGDAVVIGEPLARAAGLGVGDSFPLTTPSGERSFVVAGVVYDYSSGAGSVLMPEAAMTEAFGPGEVNNVALFLRPGIDPQEEVDRLKSELRDVALVIRSNRDLRSEVLRIFDQTFAVTRLLESMALLVASTGIALALLVLARERAAELALYRAIGALRGQIFRLFLGEGLGLAALGLLFGTAGGIGLAAILIYVINPSYFGWSIRPAFPIASLLAQAATILVVAVLASVYPSWRASRTPAVELSRDEL